MTPFHQKLQVLEWTKDPATALATTIYLNDRYNLDGWGSPYGA